MPAQLAFDPEEWYDGNDDNVDQGAGAASDTWLGQQQAIQQQRSTEMLWERTSNAERAVHQGLPSHFAPAFVDGPKGGMAAHHSGLFGGDRLDVAVDPLLDRHAMGNLMQSVSRSRRLGITEEIGLPDPYHETDDSMGGEVAAKHRLGLGPDGAPLLQPRHRLGRSPDVPLLLQPVAPQGVNGGSAEGGHGGASGQAQAMGDLTAHVVRVPGLPGKPSCLACQPPNDNEEWQRSF